MGEMIAAMNQPILLAMLLCFFSCVITIALVEDDDQSYLHSVDEELEELAPNLKLDPKVAAARGGGGRSSSSRFSGGGSGSDSHSGSSESLDWPIEAVITFAVLNLLVAIGCFVYFCKCYK